MPTPGSISRMEGAIKFRNKDTALRSFLCAGDGSQRRGTLEANSHKRFLLQRKTGNKLRNFKSDG